MIVIHQLRSHIRIMLYLAACPQNNTIERTWSATDDCGNTATCLQIIDVADDAAPVITCPADVNLDCTDSTDPSRHRSSHGDG